MGVAEFRSTSIFITLSLPLYCAATSSTTGANALHGPHQAAQKSTRTGCSDCSTSCSNVASFTSNTPGPAMFLLQPFAEHSILTPHSTLSNGCENRQKGADAPKSKAPGRQQPQALEQPSPRAAHEAKSRLGNRRCKQNLGNYFVISETCNPVPSWLSPAARISTGQTGLESSRIVSRSVFWCPSRRASWSRPSTSSMTAGPAPLSVIDMTPWRPARG